MRGSSVMSDFSLKDYLDSKFSYLDSQLESLESKVTDIKEDQAHTSNSVKSLVNKTNAINSTLDRLTTTVELHEKRSTTLEKEFKPVREAYQKSKTIKEYKEANRKRLMTKWKYPVAIFVGLCSTAAFSAWVSHIFESIKNLFK